MLELGSHTDVGLVRSQNEDFLGSIVPEDAAVLNRKGSFFIVADGMGGHSAGDVASRTAVERALYVYYHEANDPSGVQKNLEMAVKAANKAVNEASSKLGGSAKMGTTFVGILIHGNKAYVANVGDSRCYLIRDGKLEQVSKDHSWVAMQVAMGEMTEEEAEKSDERNILVRCIGEHPDVVVDIDIVDLQSKDAMLICSDGLHGMVSKTELRLRVMQMSAQTAAFSLVDLANKNGGVDNISVQILKLHKVGPPIAIPVNGHA
ncbi:MAG TPA: Stp1/IreP family PP2C-type Ser/Thr phosphatase [Candidatus Xenobia bacterium]|jgi:serine/threonine protein phosphatase PrpC